MRLQSKDVPWLLLFDRERGYGDGECGVVGWSGRLWSERAERKGEGANRWMERGSRWLQMWKERAERERAKPTDR